MKKNILFVLIAILALTLVSCATTDASNVPDVVREAAIEDIMDHKFTTELTYKLLCDYVAELKGDDKNLKLSKDDSNYTVTLDGFRVEALVGPLAQSGEAEVSMIFKADGNKATYTIRFVGAYGSVSIGPITKQVAMGITSAGIEFYNMQMEALLNMFEGSMSSFAYAYAYEKGWFDSAIQEYEDAVKELEAMANLAGDKLTEDPTNYGQEYWEKLFPGYTIGIFYIDINGSETAYYWAQAGYGSLYDWIEQPFNWNGWHKTASGDIANADETYKITKESLETPYSSFFVYKTEPCKK